MPGMQFEFDEKGGSFYYFLVSFYALVLLPLTYYFWPSEPRDVNEQTKKKCHCEPCQIKRHLLKSSQPGKQLKRKLLKLLFLIAWIAFVFLAYKVSQVEMEWTEFNPFAVLNVDKDASLRTIRKAYKQLSLKYHPDKGGDAKRFMMIAKAYAALTNEQSRKNWQEYGNPDGPEAAQFGIALPKWIVEKRNSVWVLGVYGLVFMIILPVSVGTWWYRTIKFSGDAVLLDTTRLFFYFLHRTPNMAPKRLLMILASAFEFDRTHNSEIIERPSDNEEIPMILKYLDHVNIKNREKPFCAPYSIKARCLLHAHLTRLALPVTTLQLDKQAIAKKCPYLINEMINIIAQLVALGHAGRVMHVPRLETLEHCMKLSPMVVQGLWENQSPILQLPHIAEDMLRHFVTRKRNIKTIRQLAEMSEEDRRTLVRTLTDDQYRDVTCVLAAMPLVSMECHSEVVDEEDPTITAGSIVTVTVLLRRRAIGSLFPAPVPGSPGAAVAEGPRSASVNSNPVGPLYSGMSAGLSSNSIATLACATGDGSDGLGLEGAPPVPEVEIANGGLVESTQVEQSPKKKSWEKVNKKKKSQQNKGGKAKKFANKFQQQQQAKQAAAIAAATSAASNNTADDALPTANGGDSLVPAGEGAEDQTVDNSTKKSPKASRREDAADSDSDDSVSDVGGTVRSTEGRGAGEEDDGWQRFQEEARKENSLETKEKSTHQVHCPYFPDDKTEWWWIYMADRKNHRLMTAPVQIGSLQSEEEVQLKFTAPLVTGTYVYSVCLKSDSYLDFDVSQNLKIVVKEAMVVEDHPQWKQISDDEVNKSGEESDVESNMSDGSNTDYDYDD